MTTIAVYTSGGDAPGLNTAISAITRAAHRRSWNVVGIRHGLEGLIRPPDGDPTKGVMELTPDIVSRLHHQGGTLLGAVNDVDIYMDDLAAVPAMLHHHGIDAMVAVGGDGTQTIAHALHLHNVPLVGVPKTIDNDLEGTRATLGFSTAVEYTADALGRLRDTADAHKRVIVVEVMGREAGWIALYGGVAGGADTIIIPELPFDVDHVVDCTRSRSHSAGVLSPSQLLVVAEGAFPLFATGSTSDPLSGLSVGAQLAHRLSVDGPLPTRYVALGHLLRGGRPGAEDRLHGFRLGVAAVNAIADGRLGVLVGWDGQHVTHVPLVEVAGRTRTVNGGDVTIATGRDLGICFGHGYPR